MKELLKWIASLSPDEIDSINRALCYISPNCSLFDDVANAVTRFDDKEAQEIAWRLRQTELDEEDHRLIGTLSVLTDTALWPGVGFTINQDGSWTRNPRNGPILTDGTPRDREV